MVAALGLSLAMGAKAAPGRGVPLEAERGAQLEVSAFMAATGALVPLTTHSTPASATAPGYLQFALDPRMPTGLLLAVALPVDAQRTMLRFSVRQGRAPPEVTWVRIPRPLGLDRPARVHVPHFVDSPSFCDDVVIEVATGERVEPLLRRVVRFTCGE